jgi:protein-ribulosamine 3-kinase
VRLPDPIRGAVEAALAGAAGGTGAIAALRPVGGGCISPTARLETATGAAFFLKLGAPGLPGGMLAAEADGLRALAAAGAVRVPGVVGCGGEGPDAWLLLEWLEPGRPGPDTWADLGRALAALHRAGAGGTPTYGADRPNYIGSLHQDNTPARRWSEFWRDRRLEPQLRAALDRGLLTDRDHRRFDALFAELDPLLSPADDDGPSLLHGDLWNGNVHVMEGGVAALVDPSAYRGHREVDLAMADLFGGFPSPFRAAYTEAWPLAPGYEPARRAVYQLYYLMVHVNLFGAGYVAGTRSALAAAGA